MCVLLWFRHPLRLDFVGWAWWVQRQKATSQWSAGPVKRHKYSQSRLEHYVTARDLFSVIKYEIDDLITGTI